MTKLCHAAALALVGWYLLLPPIDGSAHPMIVRSGAPLSQWKSFRSYDTADACERQKNGFSYEQYTGEITKEDTPERKAAILRALEASQCVATDDPRLKDQ